MPEREQRRRVDHADLAAPARAADARYVDGWVEPAPGKPTGSRPDGSTAPAEHVGDRLRALLAGEEAAHHAGQPVDLPAQVVGPPDEQHRDDRRAGGEQRLEQLLLAARQVEVGDVAALARGALAEQPGLVAEHDHAHVGVRPPTATAAAMSVVVAAEHRAAQGVGDLVRRRPAPRARCGSPRPLGARVVHAARASGRSSSRASPRRCRRAARPRRPARRQRSGRVPSLASSTTDRRASSSASARDSASSRSTSAGSARAPSPASSRPSSHFCRSTR